ncbi:hypothetical protein AD944_01065, partial [Acetobacter tropicalis]
PDVQPFCEISALITLTIMDLMLPRRLLQPQSLLLNQALELILPRQMGLRLQVSTSITRGLGMIDIPILTEIVRVIR